MQWGRVIGHYSSLEVQHDCLYITAFQCIQLYEFH